MSGALSQVCDLSLESTSRLRRDLAAKLRELDSFADDSLTEYIMVLLANRHGAGKIISELEDFISPMLVESFVQWLFSHVEQLKNDESRMSLSTLKKPIQDHDPKNSHQNVPVTRGVSSLVTAEEDKRALEGRSRRLFSNALRGVDGVAPNDVNKDAAPSTHSRQGGRGTEPDDLRHMIKRNDSDRRLSSRDRPSRSPEATASSRRHRRRSRSPKRLDKVNLRERDYRRRRSSKSRSPPPLAASKTIRYQSIGKRIEDEEICDARQLLSRRTVRCVFQSERSMLQNDAERPKLKQPFVNASSSSSSSSSDPHRPNHNGEQADGNKMIRCSYWPNCKAADSCPFAHPSEPCKHFPNCIFGEKCIYIHPAIPCKFQDRCQNPSCNYQHSSPAILSPGKQSPFNVMINPYQPPSAIPCRFFPNCKNTNCPFLHPSTAACKFGGECQRPACPYSHPNGRILACKAFVNAPCRYGKNCSKLDCPFQHAASPTSILSPQTAVDGLDGPNHLLDAQPEPMAMNTS